MRRASKIYFAAFASVLMLPLNGIGPAQANDPEIEICHDQLSTFAQNKDHWVSRIYSADSNSLGSTNRRVGIDYLPVLSWSRGTVSPTGDCQDSSGQVEVSEVVARGAGSGFIHILFESGCSTKRVCELQFNGKRYNLNKAQVRKRLSCERLPFITRPALSSPRITEDPVRYSDYWPSVIAKAQSSGVITSEWQSYPPRGSHNSGITGGWFTAPIHSDLCLPVPDKPGRYGIAFFGQDVGFRFPARGWEYRCSRLYSSIYCRWVYAGPTTHGFAKTRLSADVVVKKDNVTLEKVKWDGWALVD